MVSKRRQDYDGSGIHGRGAGSGGGSGYILTNDSDEAEGYKLKMDDSTVENPSEARLSQKQKEDINASQVLFEALIASGATKSDIESEIKLALSSGGITAQEAKILRQKFIPRAAQD